ncbi:hypothetical protein [Kribbella sp. CA-293567]|uniref:hypothetical protein n=1 Tax=Kribbella sp. CA-293567 TaxID=3002436 RepID=UPI0022DD3566|nr:hypothetical protein [Kribbella sp. CA-293567]WBQ07104.1 hypothetical protein OX958_09950 [Kribbella sp. CA-293567]
MSCSSSWSVVRPATRRIVIGGAITALAAPAVLGILLPTAAAAAPGSASSCGQHLLSATTQQRACILDGFAIDHLPGGIGSPSDFEYEWEEVVFHSRVWETGPDPEGATKVDLTAKTIRGEKVIDLETLRTFLTEYHEKDPESWELTAVDVAGYGGYRADDLVFFFVEPGIAAEVSIDRVRFSDDDLLGTATNFRPVDSA